MVKALLAAHDGKVIQVQLNTPVPGGPLPHEHHGEAVEWNTHGGLNKSVRYTEYQHGPKEHDAWNRALLDQRLIDWLFAVDK